LSGGSGLLAVKVMNNDTSNYWQIAYSSNGNVNIHNIASPQPSADVWWQIKTEIVISSTVGEVDMWVNGVQIVNATGLDTSSMSKINDIQCMSYTPSGSWNVLADNLIFSPIDIFPRASYIQPSNMGISSILQSSLCTFSTQWLDMTGILSNFVFSWNGTGTMTNDTASVFSGSWSNITKTLPSSADSTITWQIYAEDNNGDWGSTGIETFTIIANMSLNVVGSSLVNLQGDSVILHGVNAFAFTDAPGGFWYGSLHNNYDAYLAGSTQLNAQLDAIKSWGGNCIRVLTAAQYWIDNTGNTRQIYQDFATRCAQRGIYVIYEGWMVEANGQQNDLPYPPYTPGQGTDPGAVIGSEQDYINYMTSEAQILKDYPNVILGMWNEPVLANTTVEANWFNVVQRAITSMRATGCNNVILVQDGYGTSVNLNWYTLPPNPPFEAAGQNALDWIENYPLSGLNIAYQTHLYDSIQTSGDYGVYPGYGSNNVTYDQVMLGFQYMWFQYVTQTLHKCLIIGEIGCLTSLSGQAQTDEYNTFNNYLMALNNLSIGYTAWTFRVGVPYALISSDYPTYTPTTAGTILKNNIAPSPP
jgi:hypothetical protein